MSMLIAFYGDMYAYIDGKRYKLGVSMSLIPVEDVNVLKEVCDTVKRITSGMKCEVDKRKKRIALAPSAGIMALMMSRRPGPSILGAAQFQSLLEQLTQVLERDYGIKLVFDGMSAVAALVGAPIHYFKVFRSQRRG